MSKNELEDKYMAMLTEEKSSLKAPGTTDPEGFEKGTTKAKEFYKNSGPKEVEGTEDAVEAPEELSPVKKGLTKESTTMDNPSFMELFDQVMKEEVDGIEDPAYDDNAQDFPPAADEDGDMGGEEVTVTLTGDQVSVLKDIIAQLEGEGEGEMDMEMDAEMDMPVDDGLGEAVSEPEPKELSANTAQLQAPCKLGRDGVKVTPKKKAALSAGAKKRTGEPEAGPKGFTPGNKGMMKVQGSGSAAKGKNASLAEDN